MRWTATLRMAGAALLVLLSACAAEDAADDATDATTEAASPEAEGTPAATATEPTAAAEPTTEAGATAAATATATATEVAGGDAGSCELAPGVTDTTITFGVSTPQSGAAASIGADALAGQNALVAAINDEGGINGRMLELVVQDDEFNPERTVTNVQFLIEQEDVFAIWGNVGSAPSSAALPVITGAGRPFAFPYTLGRDITEPFNPLAFAVTTTAFDQLHGLSDLLAEDPEYADRNFGMITINSPDGAETVAGFRAGASADRLVSEQTYDRGATSFQPQLITAADAGAQVVYVGVNDVQYSQILTEVSQLGLDLDIIGAAGVVTQGPFELVPDLIEGQRAITFTAPDATGEGEQLQALTEAVEATVPGHVPGSFAVHSWLGGILIREALEQVGECVSVDGFVAALEGLSDFDTGGLSGPVSFSADDHRGNRAVAMFEAQGGVWTPYSEFVEVEA